MPRCCMLLICCPAIPTYTFFIDNEPSSQDCACFTAERMDCTVFSILATTPCITPNDSLFPSEIISILLCSFRRPIKQAIFVVPISKPTTILLVLL